MMGEPSPPISSRCFETTLIPVQETVTWRIQKVSDILRDNAWTALSIPMEVGLGPTEISRWSISLQARNNNTMLCARAMLLSPQELTRRVTHRLKVAVFGSAEAEGGRPVYYFPNTTNRNSNTETSANPVATSPTTTNNDNRCMSLKKIRQLFSKNVKLDQDQDELGDGTTAKEARPGHKGHPSLWKILPIDKITPDEHDCIELRVTMTVYGCDVMEER